MDLAVLWFWIVAFLFVGYFVLDGFDFGVGMSLPFLAKDDTDRRVLINTIGPVWDLNETWVIVAGASLFAAFPEWYATLFSGFYLALLLILVALIARGVSFEYRHQRPEAEWKRRFDWMIIIGSAVPALLWGVAFANIVASSRSWSQRPSWSGRDSPTAPPGSGGSRRSPHSRSSADGSPTAAAQSGRRSGSWRSRSARPCSRCSRRCSPT
jgi:hypothetical protein